MKKTDKKHIILIIMRLLFFLLFPAVFATAFAGVKQIATQIGDGAPLELNSLTATLMLVLIFTILFGRFFCGFACAFGTYGDFLYELSTRVRKKMKKRPLTLGTQAGKYLSKVKYGILAIILILCIGGKNLLIQKISPWDVFSRLQARNIPTLSIGILIFLLISVGMIFEKRFFCRFLCPLGAIFSFLPVLPLSIPKRDREHCIPNCKACKLKCPANLDIASTEEGDTVSMGECFSCGKCTQTCPRSNVHPTCAPTKGTLLPWHLIRGLLLLALFFYMIGI